ncbi:hypothetical protein [Streptantibioticus silvisoli]|uniref:Transposase n=1 Tax=Streptantibioticus silvisoli TaxID=2705255 RepID=A0ABT6WAK2_9ACTN|nr:hypothetical protein [Streptantibioticus silvisoli]MDI5967311.1 hypothetical protein [Streptantibioticus silvisoli]
MRLLGRIAGEWERAGAKDNAAIASDESFSGRTRTFTGPRLRTVNAGRPTFNGAIIRAVAGSRRLARTTPHRSPDPAAAAG